MRFRARSARFACLAAVLILPACVGGGDHPAPRAQVSFRTPAPASPQPSAQPAPVSAKPGPGISLMAGTLGGPGNIDGAGGRLAHPTSVASAPSGLLYVVDNGYLRSVDLAADGASVLATLGQRDNYRGIAVDKAGNRYHIAGGSIIKVTPAGATSTLAGVKDAFGLADGLGPAARFGALQALAVDGNGTVYATDSHYHNVRKILADGQASTVARGNVDKALAVDSAGNVYFGAGYVLRKISPSGVVSDVAGNASSNESKDGQGSAAGFSAINGLAADAAGNIYATDYCAIRKVTPAGVVTTLAGDPRVRGTADGKGAQARVCGTALALGKSGNLYVVDQDNFTLRQLTPDGVVTTVAGKAAVFEQQEAAFARVPLSGTRKLAVDAQGDVYVEDELVIRKAGRDGTLRALALPEKSATGATIRYFLGSLASGGSMVSFADGVVSRVDARGVPAFLAGRQGTQGSIDGVGADARFSFVEDAFVDTAGNVHVSDTAASAVTASWKMRRISASGVVTTLGPLYVEGAEDARGNRYFIRYAAATGESTVVRAAPDGKETVLDRYAAGDVRGTPGALAVDKNGNYYVAETGPGEVTSSVIRRTSTAGSSAIIAGARGALGVALGRLPGSLGLVKAMALGRDGVLYVASEQAILRIVQ